MTAKPALLYFVACVSIFVAFIIYGFTDRHAAVLASDTQTAPQGMVLVQAGNEQPFYISAIEEPNINWHVYVSWLKDMYVSYPDMHKYALPRDTMTGLWQYYNDPLIENYFEHPSYQWYPVVGVSWMQVREYMEWKTDRLNEMILYEAGLARNHQRIWSDDFVFTTESYLAGNISDRNFTDAIHKKLNKNLVEANDGILFPHYRLPTEQEWDMGQKYISDPSKLTQVKSSIRKKNFLNFWIRYFNLDPVYPSYKRKDKGLDFGNFTGGVSEWLLDNETYKWKTGSGTLDILLGNGWKDMPDDGFDRAFANVMDSVGHFSYKWAVAGKFLYPPKAFSFRFKDTSFANPFYRKDSAYIEKALWSKHSPVYLDFYKFWFRKPAFWQFLQQNGYVYPGMSVDSMHHLTLWKVLKDNRKDKRKVITGNFRHPGKQVNFKEQEASSPFTGFRCVLPYTGQRVNKKYKVKW